MKYFILSGIFSALILSSILTDRWLDRRVEQHHQEVGYTAAQIRSLNELAGKASAKVVLFRPKNEAERVAMMRTIFAEAR